MSKRLLSCQQINDMLAFNTHQSRYIADGALLKPWVVVAARGLLGALLAVVCC